MDLLHIKPSAPNITQFTAIFSQLLETSYPDSAKIQQHYLDVACSLSYITLSHNNMLPIIYHIITNSIIFLN